jgi:alginate O-acetyltransferase complex protein AlgI
MLFNSLQFLVFFAFVVSLFYALPHKRRWILLVTASSYFYMVFVPEYLLILFGIILIDYVSGFLIERNHGAKRKLFLALSLCSNLGVLVFFKYYNFFLESTNNILHVFHLKSSLPYLEVILPIGLSFHTFQAMSYTIEVYRGKQTAEKHLGIYALYVLYFPQLVAGPIERPQNLLWQFKQEVIFSRTMFREGLILMCWGFFKKVVVADRLAEIVDYSFGSVDRQSTLDMWIAASLYSIQIYCDFSGYTDIARGASKTMGVDLMENFKNPYLSTSLTEFWRRWHISLSTWFRDYLYIPLGGNRKGKLKFCRNILIVFLLSGLWHGANYTFIIWGLIHALVLLAEHFLLPEQTKKPFYFLGSIYVFFVATLAWVFFRSINLDQASKVYEKLFSFQDLTLNIPFGATEMIFIVILILLLFTLESPMKKLNTVPSSRYYLTLYTLILVCYIFGIFNYKQFIYFQF